MYLSARCRANAKSKPLVAASAMSRQILSYSDLDTSTTVTTRTVKVPNPNARHPEEVQPMPPPKKKRKTNTAHNRRTSMNIGLNQSSAAHGQGEFSSALVSSPLLKARTDDRAAQSHWDTAPTSDATITLVYAENEPGPSNPLPEAGQASLAGPSDPIPISAPPIMDAQFVGAPIALRKSFPASRPQPTPVVPSTRSPAPAKPSQRANNANDKKGKGKGSSNTSFPKTSRHLTQEEIWDDSSLVNAWDAAMDQYRVSGISGIFPATPLRPVVVLTLVTHTANEWREGLVCGTGKGIPSVSVDSHATPHCTQIP